MSDTLKAGKNQSGLQNTSTDNLSFNKRSSSSLSNKSKIMIFNNKLTSTPTPSQQRERDRHYQKRYSRCAIDELDETTSTLSSNYGLSIEDHENYKSNYKTASTTSSGYDSDDDIYNFEYKINYINNLEKLLIKKLYTNVSLLEAYLNNIKNLKKFLNDFDDNDCRPLYYAIKANSLNSVKLLISYGADLKQTTKLGDPAAHLASLIGAGVHILEYLLSFASSSSTSPQNNLYDYDQEGWTIFHCACNQGNLHIIKYLIKKKSIDFNVKDNKCQFTGLHLAIRNNHMHVVNYLMNFSCIRFDRLNIRLNLINFQYIDINSQDNYGQTPLHLACKYGIYDAVYSLLKNYGSNLLNVNIQDYKGRTCLDLAWNWLINYDIVNLNTNEKLEIFYNNKFYMQKNAIIDTYEIDNQMRLLHLLCQYGAKFSSIETILYDKKFLKAKLDKDKPIVLPVVSSTLGTSLTQIDRPKTATASFNSYTKRRIINKQALINNDDDDVSDDCVTPILNYLKCLSFIFKLDVQNLFLIIKQYTNSTINYHQYHSNNNCFNENSSESLIKQSSSVKTKIIENLILLRRFIDEQVYNSFEKHIYFEKIKILLIIVTGLQNEKHV